MDTPIIEARAISKHFGKVRAVRNVDVLVRAGQVTALLGPNGAGKTTTLRMLTTLSKPDSGSITVAGYDAIHQTNAVRSHIGVTGQAVSLDESLSGLQNLVMIGRLYHFSGRVAKRRAQELLQQFGLSDAARRAVKTYSGGMRRRLDLAASLVAMPPILFLDEPTTGLDPQSRNEVWKTVRQLVAKGGTVVLTTQYLEEADQLADYVYVIDHGSIIAAGTPAKLKSKLSSERLDITLVRPSDAVKLKKILDRVQSPETDNGTLSFTIADGEQGLKEITALLQLLIAAKMPVETYSIQRPTLEEVFLRLIAKDKAGSNTRGDV